MNADQIMDAISSEDIGKLPDENIGEALQRIPGVTLDREAGEGKGISIRGLGAGLSQVTINGQQMASTEGSREFNFSVLDSSAVAALEVWKSPMASQVEGSIGGTVNIRTRNPLDYKVQKGNISAMAQYEDLTSKWGSKFTANYLTQNADQTWGFSIDANYSDRQTRSDQVIIPGWTQIDETDGDWSSRGWDDLAAENDALILATGATQARDLLIPGREYQGIHFAMDFLTTNMKHLFCNGSENGNYIDANNKDVIVIGGGDTGTDCIGTSLRQGCKSMVNFELLPMPPNGRADDNPWPEWPKILRVDYGHEESTTRFGQDPREYCILSKEFVDNGSGRLVGIKTVQVEWTQDEANRWHMKEVPGSEKTWKADLILLSMGFLGPEHYVSDSLSLEHDARSNYKADYGRFATNVPGVFTAGDCRRGQSLVVWAINEGRASAREVDRYLMGSTDLP